MNDTRAAITMVGWNELMNCLTNNGRAMNAGERAEALEGSLLNMFGLKKRPRPQRQDIVVPEFLVELYQQQTGLHIDTTNLNTRGKLTQTANTVRTFANQGASRPSLFSIIYI